MQNDEFTDDSFRVSLRLSSLVKIRKQDATIRNIKVLWKECNSWLMEYKKSPGRVNPNGSMQP